VVGLASERAALRADPNSSLIRLPQLTLNAIKNTPTQTHVCRRICRFCPPTLLNAKRLAVNASAAIRWSTTRRFTSRQGCLAQHVLHHWAKQPGALRMPRAPCRFIAWIAGCRSSATGSCSRRLSAYAGATRLLCVCAVQKSGLAAVFDSGQAVSFTPDILREPRLSEMTAWVTPTISPWR